MKLAPTLIALVAALFLTPVTAAPAEPPSEGNCTPGPTGKEYCTKYCNDQGFKNGGECISLSNETPAFCGCLVERPPSFDNEPQLPTGGSSPKEPAPVKIGEPESKGDCTPGSTGNEYCTKQCSDQGFKSGGECITLGAQLPGLCACAVEPGTEGLPPDFFNQEPQQP